MMTLLHKDARTSTDGGTDGRLAGSDGLVDRNLGAAKPTWVAPFGSPEVKPAWRTAGGDAITRRRLTRCNGRWRSHNVLTIMTIQLRAPVRSATISSSASRPFRTHLLEGPRPAKQSSAHVRRRYQPQWKCLYCPESTDEQARCCV
jgi:hypothetical protein